MKTLYIDCSSAAAEEITSKILKELSEEKQTSQTTFRKHSTTRLPSSGSPSPVREF